jgi:predicted NBD/HSP70 family sugar kinase
MWAVTERTPGPVLSPAHINILRLLNQSGPLSRTELVALSGISKATMSALVADLIAQSYLQEGEIVYGAGRPSIRLELVAKSAFFIGVSLAGAPFIALATDLTGAVVDTRTFEAATEPEQVVRTIASAVAEIAGGGAIDPSRIGGVGLAIPGLVDAAASVCVRSTLLGWRDVPIGSMVAEATGFPTFMENDANAATVGEHLFGGLRGSDDCTLISVGAGVGCGHVLGGELHRGYRGGSGEIAHATIELDGPPCICGKRGCLDTMASLRAIASHAREAGLPTSLAELEVAATRGDLDAIRILHRAGSALGLAVSHIIQSLAPEKIVVALGDGLTDSLYARVMRQTVDANVMPQEPREFDLRVMAVDHRAWAIGAASVAAARLFFRA